jgi:tetratricopeptide (TPR) repeat protein
MAEHLQAASRLGYPADRLKLEQAMARAEIGDLQTSESALYDEMLKSDRDNREICEALVSGYLRTWQIQKAIAIIDGWSSDFPDDPQPFAVKGKYFAGRGSWESAIDAFETALQLAPHRTDLRMELAQALVRQHRYDNAVGHFEKSLEQLPGNDLAWTGLGRCWLKTGNAQKAIECARQAVAINSENARAQHLLGQIEASRNNITQALPPLEHAYRKLPHDPDIRYAYAMALRTAGRTEEAAKHFRYIEEQQAAQSQMRHWLTELEKTPHKSDLRVRIGKMLLQYGDPLEGVMWLRSALLFDPDNETALKLLAESAK